MKRLAGLSPVWIAVVLLYGVAGIVSPAMLSRGQILNVLQVAAFLGLVATGQTVALLVGGIDLSVGGVVTLTNIVSTSVMLGQDRNIPFAVATCLTLGFLVGAINGTLVAVVRVAPLIATLAMNAILFGAALVYTGGAPRGSAADGFKVLGQGTVAGLPASAVSWLAVAAVVVGGTALTGGIGSAVATIGGTLFMTELVSFTNIARVSTGTQDIVQGVLIAMSVVVYRALDQRRRLT